MGNNTKKIDGLDNLLNLEFLDLSLNKIKQIKGLDKLINLKWLDLDFNQIKKINGLEKLIEKLPKLKVVDLSYNPLTKKSIQEIKQIQRNHSKIDIRIN